MVRMRASESTERQKVHYDYALSNNEPSMSFSRSESTERQKVH